MYSPKDSSLAAQAQDKNDEHNPEMEQNKSEETDRLGDLELQYQLHLSISGGLIGSHLRNIFRCETSNGQVMNIESGSSHSYWGKQFTTTYPQIQVTTLDVCDFNGKDHAHENQAINANQFDLIHMRFIHGLASWERFAETAYQVLKPGGWVEIVEVEFPLIFHDPEDIKHSFMAKWMKLILDGAQELGVGLCKTKEISKALGQEGFENVASEKAELIIGTNTKDSNLTAYLIGLFSVMSGKLISNQIRSQNDIQCLLTSVQKELQEDTIQASINIYSIRARKPLWIA